MTLLSALATEHTNDLRREAGSGRLARLAACCRPSRLRDARTAVSNRLRHRDAVCCTA